MEMMDLAEQDKTERLLSKTTPDWVGTALLSDSFLRKILTVWVVRYIAIMDNIDTDKGISDPVPMQVLFNEWHAKNTSQKVRNVFRNKWMAGIPLTTNPPYGYMKNPEDPREWIIDEQRQRWYGRFLICAYLA